MILDKKTFNAFGELRDNELENAYRQDFWLENKKMIFWAYNICCILLFFAGIFSDYSRDYAWGSANILTALRVGLVVSGALFVFIFKDHKEYPKHLDNYCFFLLMYSSLIIIVMTLMTQGNSNTLLPGVMITTCSFYIALPGRFSHVLTSAISLFLVYCFFFNYQELGLKAHFYTCFMLASTNIILIYFKKTFSQNHRTNFLVREYHREVSTAKDTILKIIGHDLKNPLTVVINKAYFAKREIEKGNLEKATKHIESIEKSSGSLSTLLQSLLDWALSERSDDPDDSSFQNISNPCSKAYEQCTEQASLKNISLKFNVEDSNFKFNTNMVETVIRNLVSNSIKFSPEDKCIEISGRNSGDIYSISIKDEGVGMSRDMISKILEGKNLISNSGTSGEKGTGVGLKLVHHFIHSHHGKLDIKSKQGQGSEFVIHLPILK